MVLTALLVLAWIAAAAFFGRRAYRARFGPSMLANPGLYAAWDRKRQLENLLSHFCKGILTPRQEEEDRFRFLMGLPPVQP